MSGFHALGTEALGTLGLADGFISMLTVENGTIVANADTLVTIAFVTAYAAMIGQSATWSGLASDTLREQAIFRSMQTIADMEKRMLGRRSSSAQTLPFPRYGMVVNGYEIASNVIPTPIKQAQAELALREAALVRASMPDETFVGGRIAEEDMQVGSLRKSVKYLTAKNSGQQPFYPPVMALMRPYLNRADELMAF